MLISVVSIFLITAMMFVLIVKQKKYVSQAIVIVKPSDCSALNLILSCETLS